MLVKKKLMIVSPELPTSWIALKSSDGTEFTASILQAVNGMLLDMLAAVARKDYEDRRRRQMEGIKKARTEGKYVGRKPDLKRRASIASLLMAGHSYSSIQETLGCSRHLIADVKKGIDTFESIKYKQVANFTWPLHTKQACSVLGISLKTYTHAKSAEDAKWAVNLDIDVIQRVSLILNIHSALRLIFDNPDNVYGFVGMKNDNEFFNGRAPLEIMAQGDFVSLYETFNRIESLCTAGW